tara:strand:- start:1127 stop:1306 length:180 start_codon:yes stop_codon:yes gene_type:complete
MKPTAMVLGIFVIAWQFMEPYQRFEVRKIGYNFFNSIAESIKPEPPTDPTQLFQLYRFN